MEAKGKTTFGSTLKVDVKSAQAAIDAISMAYQRGEAEEIKLEPEEPYYLTNEKLKETYEAMHRQGPSAWFNDGKEERGLILKMGEPWTGLRVLEIGCGEGELADMMFHAGAFVTGVDYSEVAIKKAQAQYLGPFFVLSSWQDVVTQFDRIVMQGVLEHLDDPFASLDAMIEKFKPKSIITSSPCFLNPRGIVWMTLHMLGAVMSKTDLHFLNPWQFGGFCEKRWYKLSRKDCDWDWGHWQGMIEDLRQRIPLALRDGNIGFEQRRLDELLTWLSRFELGSIGATMVYRIDL